MNWILDACKATHDALSALTFSVLLSDSIEQSTNYSHRRCLVTSPSSSQIGKPMKIDILVAPTRAPATASLVSRVTPVTNAAGGNATTTRFVEAFF